MQYGYQLTRVKRIVFDDILLVVPKSASFFSDGEVVYRQVSNMHNEFKGL